MLSIGGLFPELPGTHLVNPLGSALGSTQYHTWSNQNNFTTAAASLPAPTLSAPANGATGVVTQPQFSWSQVSGNLGYRIIVSTNLGDLPTDPNQPGGTPSNGFNVTVSQNTTSYTWTGTLSAGTTYYWEVHALGSTGGGTWSNQNNFTTTGTTFILGLDVSGNNTEPAWSQIGQTFAFIKATQGNGYISSAWPTYIQDAALILTVAPYHYADPDEVNPYDDQSTRVTDPSQSSQVLADANAEADHFYKIAAGYFTSSNLRPMLNLEDDSGNGGFSFAWTSTTAGWSAMAAWVNDWTAQFQTHVPGVYPILYMSRSYAAALAPLLNQSVYSLWIAIASGTTQYSDPQVPPPSAAGWNPSVWPWAIEQYNTDSSHSPPGDWDVLNPTLSLDALKIGIQSSTIVGRLLFYAGSTRYDLSGGSNPQTPNAFSDDNAIATDKSAYLPGSGAATWANATMYDKGINGIMVDLKGGGAHGAITLANILNDFTFKVGNDNSPGTWASAPNPTSVAVRSGAGVSGSDRVELIWADGAMKQQWLEVTVKATANTGLAANDVFFYGNEIADTGSSNTATVAKVGASDITRVQTHLANANANIPISNLYDFNRDGLVGASDTTLAQTHTMTNSTGLQFINIGAGGPFAPASTGTGDAGVASALASTSTSPTVPVIPAWIVNRLEHLDLNRVDLNHGPIAKYFEHLGHEGTPKTKAILVKADKVADALNLDDTLLDSLLAGLAH
ncbi:MAG: glycoside hydrolase family 25 protein [Planctomycetia bacterium]|nr:glycoside hydrolase family 25 protein [Planctomycetia bacterium]